MDVQKKDDLFLISSLFNMSYFSTKYCILIITSTDKISIRIIRRHSFKYSLEYIVINHILFNSYILFPLSKTLSGVPINAWVNCCFQRGHCIDSVGNYFYSFFSFTHSLKLQYPACLLSYYVQIFRKYWKIQFLTINLKTWNQLFQYWVLKKDDINQQNLLLCI